jgi:hypothetical protein
MTARLTYLVPLRGFVPGPGADGAGMPHSSLYRGFMAAAVTRIEVLIPAAGPGVMLAQGQGDSEQGRLEMKTVARRGSAVRAIAEVRYVMFKYGNARYTVSPEKCKVYSDWVEVETSRAAEILSAYRIAQQT